MKQKKFYSMALLCFLCMVMIVTACSSKNNAQSTQSAQTSAPSTTAASATADVIDPLGKYDPPITMNAVRPVDQAVKFEPGQTIDNNVWNTEYENVLGIKLKYAWTTDTSAYTQKLNVTISSNNLPDVMWVNAQQLKTLSDAGQLADLTDAFQKYASPNTKEIYNRDGGLALKSATFNGKLLAIPQLVGGNVGATPMLWIRTDWLKKLNLPEPKTFQDVLTIADAFTNKDPDGNGKKDTTGLALVKDVYGTIGGIDGFLQAFHAYPTLWVKDASGQLAYGSVQPEMKAGLAKLQELYKNGQIDQEFAVKDGGKIGEAVAQNKVGMMFGVNWLSYFPLADGVSKNPGMEWTPFEIPSADDKPFTPGASFPVSNYLVVKKGYSNPEAAVKMINLYNERANNPQDEATFYKFNSSKDGQYYPFHYSIMEFTTTNIDMDFFKDLKPAIAANDPSKLKTQERSSYDAILAYEKGDKSQWPTWKQRAPENSAYVIMDRYLSKVFTSEFYGAPTSTMTDKWSTLDKMERETMNKIIMGAAPVDEFDNFVANWKKLGGDQITKEVNDWNTSQK